MEIPLSAEEIVSLPMDDFNERLARLQLSEAQLSLVRDVRRRGKNKVGVGKRDGEEGERVGVWEEE